MENWLIEAENGAWGASTYLYDPLGERKAGGPGTDCSFSRPASRIQSVPRSSRSCDERAAGGPDLGKNFIQVGMHAAPRPSGRRDREEYFSRFIVRKDEIKNGRGERI